MTRLNVIKRITLARLLIEFVDMLNIVFIRSSKSVSTFKTYQLRFAAGRKSYCNQGNLTEQYNRVINVWFYRPETVSYYETKQFKTL